MRYLYRVLFYLVIPFVFLRLLWRARFSRTYPYRFAERLGFCPHRLSDCIWVHAVSLGETIAAVPLIKGLQKRYPGKPILVTNMTATGLARVAAVFGDSVKSACIPYDLVGAVNRFLGRVNPQVAVIMETELWPELLAACKKRGIPVVIANARLSEKSANGYRRVLPLVREMFTAIHRLAVHAQPDAERFIALGMPRERVTVTGSLKYDLDIAPTVAAAGAALREQLGQHRFVWIAASTHPSEETVMLAAHAVLREKIPNALLILVPRHPERFDAVAAEIIEKKFSLVRRSEKTLCDTTTSVYLADSVGEMLLLYAASDVACVAGSFAQVGGHNMIEPAALSKPILTGPCLFNFAEISADMLQAGAMQQVENAKELAAALIQFAEDPALCVATGKKALDVVIKNRGSLQKQLTIIAEIVQLT